MMKGILFQGPIGYCDTKFVGKDWHFNCHAILVLPINLIPTSLPEYETRLTVFFPEASKDDAVSFLTYCYSGRWEIFFERNPFNYLIIEYCNLSF